MFWWCPMACSWICGTFDVSVRLFSRTRCSGSNRTATKTFSEAWSISSWKARSAATNAGEVLDLVGRAHLLHPDVQGLEFSVSDALGREFAGASFEHPAQFNELDCGGGPVLPLGGGPEHGLQ